MRKFIIVVVLVLLALTTHGNAWQAETHYVRDGGSCTNNCHDWSNAYDQLTTLLSSGDLSRGDTIYVADGSYSTFTFSLTNSSTARVEIRKCTAADHGTETGYNASDCNGQATIGSFTLTTGYITIDGQTGGGPNDWECASCGFVFTSTPSVGDGTGGSPGNPDGVIIRHAEIDLGQTGVSQVRGMFIWDVNDFLMEYVYLHHAGCDLVSGGGWNSFTIQYSKLGPNYQDPASPPAGCHGDTFEHQAIASSAVTMRWNFFEDVVGTYLFGTHDPRIDDYEIYGNIIYVSASEVGRVYYSNGMIEICCGGSGPMEVRFYNNSIVGAITGDQGVLGCAGFSGSCETRNNIWDRASGSTAYNVGLGDTSSGNTCYDGPGGCDQNLTGTPFTNVSGKDLTLTGATSAGTTLGSPYNVDMFGTTRGADGTWDRGAIEFDSGAAVGPTVTITTPTSSATYSTDTSPLVSLAGTASDDGTVTGCTWVNSAGGSGSATGTTSWSVSNITLTEGSNVITVTCEDDETETGEDVITITYTPAATPAVGRSRLRIRVGGNN